MALTLIAILIPILYLLYLSILFITSPLSKIPKAHWSVSIFPAWILWARFRLCENSSVQIAHAIHGPIIRLAPNELSINFVDGGIKTVYGSFEKHVWYRSFWNMGLVG